ncbi:MAG: YfhO family protein [Desulfobacteraceae bacterium]|nr:YfhO family protein [Desulfobacteraceae bacterium]MBC2757889.1 YfhO family protein [Desulfobacteraceae bacterium]
MRPKTNKKFASKGLSLHADSEKSGHSDDLFEKINGFYLFLPIVLLIQLFVFKDYIFLEKLLVFLDAGSDAYNQFYPGFMHSARYIRTDGIPTWSFHSGMGQSIFPGGITSPFIWILNLFGPERLAYGIVFVEILKSAVTGIVFYFFLKVLNLSKFTCIAGGVMASFLGYLILGSSGWYGHSSNVVYFVLILYAFELFYKKGNWLLFPIAVFFTAGNPFRLYLYAVFIFTYALLRILSDNTLSLKESIIFLLKLAGLGAVGVGVSAVFTYNSLLEMLNSPRVSGDVKATGSLLAVPVFALADRLEAVTSCMRFFSNDLMGTGSNFTGWVNYLEAPAFYSGLLSLLLFPQVFLFSDRRKKIVFAGFFFFWMIPLVFPFFRFALYAFMGNYYKHGLSLFIPVMFLIYGLYGLEHIQKKNTANDIVLVITLMIMLAVLYFPFFSSTPHVDAEMIHNGLRLIISCFLLVYAGLLYFLKFDKLKNPVKLILLTVLCIEAGYLSSITVNNRTPVTREQFESKVGYNDYTVEGVAYIKSVDSGFYRINKDYPSPLGDFDSINDAKVHGYFGTPSYSSFNKQEYIEFLKAVEIIEKGKEVKTRWAIGLLQRPLLQAISSVRYNLVKPADFSKKNSFYKLTYEPITQFGDVMVMKNKYALPFGFTYDMFLNRKDFDHLSKTQKDMAMFIACVTDKDLVGLNEVESNEIKNLLKNFSLKTFTEIVEQKRTGSMDLTNFSQKKIKGEIFLEKKKLLFFSIPFDKGWKAFDNGHPVPIIQANIGFSGIILDKGAHRIELNYLPEYIKPALCVSIFFLIIYMAMGFLKIFHWRK